MKSLPCNKIMILADNGKNYVQEDGKIEFHGKYLKEGDIFYVDEARFCDYHLPSQSKDIKNQSSSRKKSKKIKCKRCLEKKHRKGAPYLKSISSP